MTSQQQDVARQKANQVADMVLSWTLEWPADFKRSRPSVKLRDALNNISRKDLDALPAGVADAIRLIVKISGRLGGPSRRSKTSPGRVSPASRDDVLRACAAIYSGILAVEAAERVARLADWPAEDTSAGKCPTSDPTAYVFASECLDPELVPGLKKLHAILERCPWIHRYNPSPRRLKVHGGDWLRFIAEVRARKLDALAVSAEMAAKHLEECRERQEGIRNQKKAAGK
jgi:hypothetical protein